MESCRRRRLIHRFLPSLEDSTETAMNILDPIVKNPLPYQNRSYQTPMSDQQFEVLLRTMVHVSV